MGSSTSPTPTNANETCAADKQHKKNDAASVPANSNDATTALTEQKEKEAAATSLGRRHCRFCGVVHMPSPRYHQDQDAVAEAEYVEDGDAGTGAGELERCGGYGWR